MKCIKTAAITVLFGLTLMTALVTASAAYEIGWKSIQHRVFESGSSDNRLMFEIKDDSGNYVSSASVVTKVVLKAPDQSTVTLSTLKYNPLYSYYGARFDLNSFAWNYYNPQQISSFRAKILDPLTTGTYTLEVTLDDGVTLTADIDFDFLLDLPFVTFRSFQIHSDSSGNLHWTWHIPKDLLSLANSYTLQYRAGVSAVKNGQETALFWPNIPVEVGYSFVPSNIYQTLISDADELQFWFQVRTSNNNARAYSKTVTVKDLSSPISIVPKKNIAVIPLN